jgi:hypothetical protein
VGVGVGVGVGVAEGASDGLGVGEKKASVSQSKVSSLTPPVAPQLFTAETSHLYVLPWTTGKEVFTVGAFIV